MLIGFYNNKNEIFNESFYFKKKNIIFLIMQKI